MTTDPNDGFSKRPDGVVIPRIGVALALSLLLHVAALWELPKISVDLPEQTAAPDRRATLNLRLVPPGPPPSPDVTPPSPPPAPAQQAQRPKPAPRPKPPPAPPVIALDKPRPAPQSPVTPPPAAPPVVAGDMDAYIEARRRARGATTQAPPEPVEDDDARRKRIIAGNLGTARERTFGYDPARGGGVFQIERLSDDYAEFLFHGWNKDIGRNSKQLIEVRRGNNSDIRIAVVRRMIAIIREYEKEDFLWVSRRLGRSLMLSARDRDNTGLEEFMMREFFAETRPAQR